MRVEFAILGAVALAAGILWRHHKHKAWLASLKCNRCAALLATNMQLADQLRMQSLRAIHAAACDLGLKVNLRSPELRFPCEQCHTIHVLTQDRSCTVSESQEFEWPDPQLEACKWSDAWRKNRQHHNDSHTE